MTTVPVHDFSGPAGPKFDPHGAQGRRVLKPANEQRDVRVGWVQAPIVASATKKAHRGIWALRSLTIPKKSFERL